MPVHVRRRQHVRPIHRDALRLVHRRRIAVVDVRVVPGVERHHPAVLLLWPRSRSTGAVQPHRQPLALGRHLQHRAQRAVLHRNAIPAVTSAKPTLVALEHDAVAGRKGALAPLRLHHLVRPAQLAAARMCARASTFRSAHVVARVGQDHLAGVWTLPTRRIPARHQRRLRLRARAGAVHHAAAAYRSSASAVRPVASSRVASRCQSSRCRRTAVISRAPCRSASARNAAPASIACSCSGSPTSTTLAPACLRRGQHPLHLPRADHSRLVHHQHVPAGQLVAPVLPGELQSWPACATRCRCPPPSLRPRCRTAPPRARDSPPPPTPPAPPPASRSCRCRRTPPPAPSPPPRDMPQRRLLLVAKLQPARLEPHAPRATPPPDRPGARPVRPAHRRPLHALLGLQHPARGEPLPPALVLRPAAPAPARPPPSPARTRTAPPRPCAGPRTAPCPAG